MLGFLFAVRDVPSSTERCLFTYASAACCIQTSMLNFRWLYVLASQTEETNSDFVNWLSIVSNLILGIYYYFEAYQQQKSFGIVVQRVTKTDVHLRSSYRDWLLLQSLTSISIVLSMHIMAILAIFFFSVYCDSADWRGCSSFKSTAPALPFSLRRLWAVHLL